MMRAVFCLAAILIISSSVTALPPTPTNYQISPASGELQNEEQVWYNPIDSLVLVADWRDFRLGYRQIGYGFSTDGGNSWFASLVPTANQMFMQQSDPTLTVDNSGIFYMSMLDYQPSATSLYDSSYISFLISSDNGQTWSGPYTVEDGLGYYFEDKQFITVDRTGGTYDGNVYVAWARFPNPTRIMFARSTDGALTFDDTLIAGPVQEDAVCGWGSYDAGQFANPAVGADGSVYVFWNGGVLDPVECDYNYGIKMVKSTDGGQSFTAPQLIRKTYGNWEQVDGGVDVYNQPVAAVDISGGERHGNMYIAYASVDPTNISNYEYNIEFIRSLDNGETWTEPIYINDDMTGFGATLDQFHPWMVCDERTGVLTCVWYDQRTDPVNHFKFDLFGAYSFDGGATFTLNHRISDVSIDPSFAKSDTPPIEGRGTPDFETPMMTAGVRAGLFAEYIGVTTFREKVTAVWTDTRNGNQDAFGASYLMPFIEPRLITPTDGIVTDELNPVFVWSTCWYEDDDHYRLEVSDDPGFGTVLYDCTPDDNQGVYAGPALVWGNTYYWRVKAFRYSAGDSTDWSAVYSYTIGDPVCYAAGDVNNDGLVLSVADLNYLGDYLANAGAPPPVLYQADINGDCKIDMLDYALCAAYFVNGLGVFDEYPVPTCCDPETVVGGCCVGDSCMILHPDNCSVYGYDYRGDGNICDGVMCMGCCRLVGDVNHDGAGPDISDLVYIVSYMFQGGPEPPCKLTLGSEYFPECDINGSGYGPDITDLVYLVSYMFQGGPAPAPCP
ncbi:MAG TPA: hypothetical protein PLF13_09600 [candidate division Zixibacteria bacterium]|nr:hypothetical protein [candidate division Zixibacteria bacterium]